MRINTIFYFFIMLFLLSSNGEGSCEEPEHCTKDNRLTILTLSIDYPSISCPQFDICYPDPYPVWHDQIPIQQTWYPEQKYGLITSMVEECYGRIQVYEWGDHGNFSPVNNCSIFIITNSTGSTTIDVTFYTECSHCQSNTRTVYSRKLIIPPNTQQFYASIPFSHF